MNTTNLPSGEAVPVLGQGTWHLGEDPSRRSDEIAALTLGIDLGMTLIDTAEMYGRGATEELVGQVIAGRRDDVFLVSKVLPNHATTSGTVAACEASLRRLRTDHLDLYLLHWRGSVPLKETLAGFEVLCQRGLIRYWGVSNFDLEDTQDLLSTDGGTKVATNQILYNLSRRGIEWDLSPWGQSRGIPLMAYSPIEQGRLLRHPELQRVANRHHATPAQVALAWVIRAHGVIAIPGSGNPDHVRDNWKALEIQLTVDDVADLDRAFPPPNKPVPLEML